MNPCPDSPVKSAAPRSIFRKTGVLALLVLAAIILNAFYFAYHESGEDYDRISKDLEGKLKIADTLLINEIEKLKVLAGIVKGQQLKFLHFMDYDRIRPIKLMLQTISSKHDLEMLFLFDENKKLLVSNSFHVEDGDSMLNRYLLEEQDKQTGLIEIPAAILAKYKFAIAPIRPEGDTVLCFKSTVHLVHDLGNVYGYVVLVKPLTNNKPLGLRMTEMTQADIVIYDRHDRPVLSTLRGLNVAFPHDDRLNYLGKSYFIRVKKLSDQAGEPIGTLAVAIDSRDFLQHRKRLLMSSLLPSLFTIIIFFILCVLLKSRIINRVNQLSKVLRAVTIGEADLGIRMKISALEKEGFRPDEVESMCLDFNRMMGMLETTFMKTQEQAELLLNQKDKITALYQHNDMILNTAGEGIYGVDIKGLTTFANQTSLQKTGFTSENFLGKNQHELIHHTKEDGSPYSFEECPIHLSIVHNKVYQVADELFWHRDGSSFPVEYICSPIVEGEDVTGAVVVFKDITERKRMEAEKEKMQEQLVHSQKMEAIGTLAGGIAHDFNNMLTAILGYSEFTVTMMRKDKTDPAYVKYLEQISMAARRAGNLTRQLLLFSRRQPMEYTPIDLNLSIDELLKMLGRLIGENITITANLAPDLRPFLGDKGNVEQVIMNLTVNAKDAMPQGGSLTISTENVVLDEQYCKRFSLARPGCFVRLAVEDTGEGMNEETQRHIFDPFFTTKETGKGTGLGLSVVYGIMQKHKGWINVSSQPGQGTLFEVFFPAAPPLQKENGSTEPESLNAFVGAGERILLVEDDEVVREIASTALREHNYTILECGNIKEAKGIFEKEQGQIDLLFSDVVLPDESGIQLAENLLAQHPELPILLTSGYSDEQSQHEIINEKGYRFLQKPYDITVLLRAVEEVLKNHK
ncbi:MAG: response regulator [Desulfobulbaceae bacterium]|nr:response regulator [Desulfobulbaceae bacterium]